MLPKEPTSYQFAIDALTGEVYYFKSGSAALPLPINTYNITRFSATFAIITDADTIAGGIHWADAPIKALPRDIVCIATIIHNYNTRRHTFRLRETENLPLIDVTVVVKPDPAGSSEYNHSLPTAPPVVDILAARSNSYASLPTTSFGEFKIIEWPGDAPMYKGMPAGSHVCVAATTPGSAEVKDDVTFFSTYQVARAYVPNSSAAIFTAIPVKPLRLLVLDHVAAASVYWSILNDMATILSKGTIDTTAAVTLRNLLNDCETLQISLGIFCTYDDQLAILHRRGRKYLDGIDAGLREMRALNRFINIRYRVNGQIFSRLYGDLHRISIWTYTDREMAQLMAERIGGVDGYINVATPCFVGYGRFGNNKIDIPRLDEEIALFSQTGRVEYVARGDELITCAAVSQTGGLRSQTGGLRSQTSLRKIADLFPNVPGIDKSKLRATEEGIYSITKPFDAKTIHQHLLNHITAEELADMIVTDGTGNIGGDTINFALTCHHVHSIEINPENYEVLLNNVHVYGLTNVDVHNADTNLVWQDYPCDLFVMDPPWGGPGYKNKTDLDLFMGDQRVDWLVRRIISHAGWRPRIILLKLPANYNWKRLQYLPGVIRATKYPIRGYAIAILEIQPFHTISSNQNTTSAHKLSSKSLNKTIKNKSVKSIESLNKTIKNKSIKTK